MSARRYIGAVYGLCLAAITASAARGEGTLHTLRINGPNSLRINVVVLSEGYVAAEETQFLADAANAIAGLDVTSPWDEYQSYFNEYAIFVASNESGSDHHSGEEPVLRDTYFNSTYDTYGVHRALTIPPNDWDPEWWHGEGKVYALLAEHVPDYDLALVLVNDPEYGGTGGAFAVVSVHPSVPEMVLHEFGHSYAGLGDEYEYLQGCGLDADQDRYEGDEPPEPNLTVETNRTLVKWVWLILGSTPLPTTANPNCALCDTQPDPMPEGTVGLYEGGSYYHCGAYRPVYSCKMRRLGVGFCPVCREAIVRSHYERVSPIDSMIPMAPSVMIDPSEAETLRVVAKTPMTHALRLAWFVDGLPVTPASPAAAIITGDMLGPGMHTVKCAVDDTTALVRQDIDPPLRDSALWSVTVGCPCPCHGDPQCDGVANVQDVVQTVNVAFRGNAPVFDPNCLRERTDVNCDEFTTIQDVVKVVNVAFRSAIPATEFCNPCAP